MKNLKIIIILILLCASCTDRFRTKKEEFNYDDYKNLNKINYFRINGKTYTVNCTDYELVCRKDSVLKTKIEVVGLNERYIKYYE